MVEIEIDQPINRLSQKVEDHIGNPALSSTRRTWTAIGQMRKQILERVAGRIDGQTRLRGCIVIKRDSINVQSTRCSDAEIGRIAAHREKATELVDLSDALDLVRIHQKDQWCILPFIDGANDPEDRIAVAPRICQRRIGQQFWAVGIKQAQCLPIGAERFEPGQPISHDPVLVASTSSRQQIQTCLTVAAEMAAPGPSARLLRWRNFCNRGAIVASARCHFSDEDGNKCDVLGHLSPTGIVSDRIGVHTDEVGKAAHTESRALKLGKEFSVRHLNISSYVVFDVEWHMF